jgi:DNA-binding CsgD family transcriptional regulator
MTRLDASDHPMQLVVELAARVATLGREMNLPYVAVSADIGSPEPMRGPDGRPFAETLFQWVDPDLEYWKDRGFALRSLFVHAARGSAEPFFYADGRFGTWRRSQALDALNAGPPEDDAFGVASAIIAPAYLPRGVIGAVVWASSDPAVDVRTIFEARAEVLHATALKLMAAYADATGARIVAPPVRLTRREIQCLKWAAAGKTDSEVAEIVRIALPTVRFHITNAARKLDVAGRSQAVHRAATLGYIGGQERPGGRIRATAG